MSAAFLASRDRPGNVVFDLDGVVFLGGSIIAGAGKALEGTRRSGSRVVFATNNATKTVEEIADRILSGTGYATESDEIVTSAVATATMLGVADEPVFLVGESGLNATLKSHGITVTDDATAARAVAVGLDRSIDYKTIERASTAVRNGARFVATNTDVTFPTPEGPVPGAGAIVAAIAAAAGRSPEIAGKPHRAMIDSIRARLGPGPTWIVGDRPETDLALAHAAGWTPILVLSGITTDPTSVDDEWAPARVFDSIVDLARLLDQ